MLDTRAERRRPVPPWALPQAQRCEPLTDSSAPNRRIGEPFRGSVCLHHVAEQQWNTRKVAGVALMVVGGAGLLIPVVPGWLLIAAGASLAKRGSLETRSN